MGAAIIERNSRDQRSPHGTRSILSQSRGQGPQRVGGVLGKARIYPHVGDISQNWLVMKNGESVIGLFQGMFERNSLTFNPGWSQDAQAIAPFTDVREIQQQLKEAGLEFMAEADPDSTGPASFVILDPDGNPVIVDQHV